jgi:hypothetical protein
MQGSQNVYVNVTWGSIFLISSSQNVYVNVTLWGSIFIMASSQNVYVNVTWGSINYDARFSKCL